MYEKYEIVYTMTAYWDGPRSGMADYNGVPHFYDSLFDEEGDDLLDTFLLMPVDEDTFKLALEDWEIWKRWEQAWKRGEAKIDSHTALPEDRARHEQILPILEKYPRDDVDNAIKAKAKFKRDSGLEPLAVLWLKVNS